MKKTTIFITLGIVTLIGMINTKIYATERIDSEAIKENSYISMEQEINENKIRPILIQSNKQQWDISEKQDNSVIAEYDELNNSLIIYGKGKLIKNYLYSNSPCEEKIKNVEKVIIKEGITSIGDWVFYGCSSLANVEIPNSVTSIGESAFSGCNSLTSIAIPNSVTIIKNGTFSGCSGLTSITIPEGVTSIGKSAFSGCSGLTSVIIPEGVITIENSTFKDCSSITSITIPEGVTSIGSYAFARCSSLTSITIPEGVTSIENSAFSNCSSLTDITIPSSVTSIGSYVFLYCSNLTSIIIQEGVPSIGDNTFLGCTNLTNITIPEGVTSIGDNTFLGCTKLTNITIPSSVTSIGNSAFTSCSSLTNITIPSSVTSIGNSAFGGCPSLSSVTILGNETSVENEAFSACSSDLIIKTVCSNEKVKEYAKTNNITTELIHNWGEWQTIEEATFAKEGTKQRTCANDSSHIETETIAKLDKSLLEKYEAKAATCEKAGNNEYYSYNGKYYSDSEGTQEIQENSWVIEALGHDWGEATYTWNEDKTECTAERVCTRDASHKETETVKTTNSVTKEATCEEVGERTYTATFTNAAFAEQTTTEEITATGHTAGTPVEENRVESTCTENGSYDEVTYCKVCGEKLLKEKKTIPALGHDYEKIVVQPTETEQGYTLHICKRCKDEYKDNYVPSIDKKDPIQIKDDEKDITIIEKEEQKYIIVEPNTAVDTLKEAIIIEKEYTVIDKENKQKEGILATGDKITVKDTYKTSYIIIVKGDVNEDGVIDFMGDVVMLNNYRLGLIKLSKEAILAGDMNMDGKIDFVEDVVKINNYRISAVRSLIK